MNVSKSKKVMAVVLTMLLMVGSIPLPAIAEVGDVQSTDPTATLAAQDISLEEVAAGVADPLRNLSLSDQLASLWDTFSAIEVVENNDRDGSDEQVLAALEGRQSTAKGITRAFVLVAGDLGIACEMQEGVDGQAVVAVQVDETDYSLDVAAGMPGQYPWAAEESPDAEDEQQVAENGEAQGDLTDETLSEATDDTTEVDTAEKEEADAQEAELIAQTQSETQNEEDTLSKQASSATDLSKAKVKVDSQLYTGKAVKPEVEVVLAGTTLTANTDYTVSYSNNVSAGTAKVSVKGKGSYTGTATASFKIVKPSISYSVHVQTHGDQDARTDGAVAGTSGQSKRLESIKLKLRSGLPVTGGITYRTHVQSFGWEDAWRTDGAESGTHGMSKRLEAIQIKLFGNLASSYDVYYRVHAQQLGWMAWAKNGEVSGTSGLAWRLEAIQVVLVPKGEAAPKNIGGVTSSFQYPEFANPKATYRAHSQSYGWMDWVSDGATAGTLGQGKRLEAMEIKLDDEKCSGDIQYSSYFQTYGWQEWKSNGETSGSIGQANRIEAVKIKLSGWVSKYFNVWYRVHVQSYGWLGWTCNGAKAGTAGLGKRVESIEVRLVPKTMGAPGTTDRPYVVNSGMSNSPLVCYTALSPNHSGLRNHSIDTITPHYMGFDYSVEECGEIFAPVERQASSNYGIGSDGRVALYCDEWNRSWCSSNAANDHRAITIECANQSDTSLTDSCWSSLVRLCTDICERNGKTRLVYRGSANYDGLSSTDCLLTMHKWFAATACPGAWFSARFEQLANEVNANLA